MQNRSRCNIFRYIYKGRLVKISENIAFWFYKEIYMKYLILYYKRVIGLINEEYCLSQYIILHSQAREIWYTAGTMFLNISAITLYNLSWYIKLVEGSWSYGNWIYNYLCNQCLSPLTLRVRTPLRRGILDTTLCDKVCQWLVIGQ